MNRPYSLIRRIFVVSLSLLFIMPVLLSSRLQAQAARTGAESAIQPTQAEPVLLRGSVSVLFRSRTADYDGNTADDSDFFEQLRFDVYSPKKNNAYEFHFLGTARQRVSGNPGATEFYPFEDIADTYSSGVIGFVYDAHLALNYPLSYLPQVRIGRQAGTRDEPVFFDGLAADIAVSQKLNVTLYGGVAVHFYELDQNWGSDFLGGAGIDYNPFPSTGLSIDYLAVRDERIEYLGTDQSDHQYAFTLRQRFSPYVRALAKYRILDTDPRDLKVRFIAAVPAVDMEISASYGKQYRTQNELSNEFSPYVDVLGPSYPFQSYDVKVRKMFGRHFAVDVGYFQRTLLEEQQENALNRDYKRAFLVFETMDLLSPGLVLSLLGDYWDADGNSYQSAGLDAQYTFQNRKKKAATIGLGSYFSLYKYDYYVQLGERQKVRTYYLNGTVPLGKGFTATAKYEYEDSIEDYQTFKIGVRYDF